MFWRLQTASGYALLAAVLLSLFGLSNREQFIGAGCAAVAAFLVSLSARPPSP